LLQSAGGVCRLPGTSLSVPVTGPQVTMALSTASTKRHLHKHPYLEGMSMSKPSVPHTTAVRQSSEKFAAIYIRVSTEEQGNGFSLPTQLEACRALAA